MLFGFVASKEDYEYRLFYINDKISSYVVKSFPFFPQAFVENNPAIKWCPIPGCERAVRLTRQGSNSTGSDTLSFPMLKAPAVDCGKGHLFCWLVLETYLHKLTVTAVPGVN